MASDTDACEGAWRAVSAQGWFQWLRTSCESRLRMLQPEGTRANRRLRAHGVDMESGATVDESNSRLRVICQAWGAGMLEGLW